MDALSYASDGTIRAILTAVCGDRVVKSKALEYLKLLEPQALEAAKSGNETQKRKHAGLSICVQCDEPFDEQDNRTRDCHYHSGELEVDYEGDFWADHDVKTWGPHDTEENREQYPEGFIWTCCDKLGDEPGCQRGRHQANPELSKKGQGESESESEGGDEDEEEEDGGDEE